MQNIGVVTVLLLLAAFALERVGAAANFLLGEETKYPRWRKIAVFAITGGVALAIVILSNDVRIIRYVRPNQPSTPADLWLTWLVLVAGSDQVKTVTGWVAGIATAKGSAPPYVVEVVDKAS